MTAIRPDDLDRAYAILGLSPAAESDEVTCAYRRLIRAEHPDATTAPAGPVGAIRIRDIIEAYRTVQSARRRVPEPEPGSPRHEPTTGTFRSGRGAYLTAGPARPGTFTRPPDIHAQPPRIR